MTIPNAPKERGTTHDRPSALDDMHTVTLTFNGVAPTATFACHAPSTAICHAVWTCACEEWDEAGVTDGVPWHRVDDSDIEPHRHEGALDDRECNLRDWFENSDDPLHGHVTVPVTATWQGDHYTFEVHVAGAGSGNGEAASSTGAEASAPVGDESAVTEAVARELFMRGTGLDAERFPEAPAAIRSIWIETAASALAVAREHLAG